MKVTANDVSYVAELANLELGPDEAARMVKDLNSILDYMDILSELDTTSIEPMAQVQDALSPGHDQAEPAASREDVLHGLRESLSPAAALGEAPMADGTYFRVPKVIER